MESQGVGIHILMSTKTALELGCPIRGILSFNLHVNVSPHMRSGSSVTVYCWSLCNDKAGRSIPAPGRGALTITREVHLKHRPPVLMLATVPVKSLPPETDRRLVCFRARATERGFGRPQEQGQICGSRFLCEPCSTSRSRHVARERCRCHLWYRRRKFEGRRPLHCSSAVHLLFGPHHR